jgi:casein kinase II subunit beta
MNADFGRCPRLACQGQHVLPIGITDNLRTCPVNVYCPRCQEAYYTRSTRHAYIDGAYFGTTFAHIFLLHYSELIPKKSGYRYVPKIYGFRINCESPYYTQRLDEGEVIGTNNNDEGAHQVEKKELLLSADLQVGEGGGGGGGGGGGRVSGAANAAASQKARNP